MARVRDIGITIGHLPVGTYNAITDVPGVLVGHRTIIHDLPRVARTGVTMIVPREGRIGENNAFAAIYEFNGCGEMSGMSWLEESGMLSSAIGITNTAQVGLVRDMMIAYNHEHQLRGGFLPVVTETYDGWLNDIGALHVDKTHVYEAIESAQSGPVAEGNVGGGTGMICHDFKGGIGTSSRIVHSAGEEYVVGVLVQANHGDRYQLRVNGVPVGLAIPPDEVPTPWGAMPSAQGGSIIVIIATNAPLLPFQCKRLAQRATIGLGRAGGVGFNSSGDIFLVFSTGNDLPFPMAAKPHDVRMLPNQQMNPFFEAVADATEESILNALTAAETMVGSNGRTAHVLPLDRLESIMRIYDQARQTVLPSTGAG